MITGTLTGTGLVLTDSVSGAHVTVPASATTFTLAPAVASGASYNVAPTSQPTNPTESCSIVSGGTGTANANVNSIVVNCTVSTFTVGGTLTGDAVGTGLVVKDTVSGNTKTVSAGATTFTITPAVNSGASYNIAVTAQPTNPTQNCTVAGGGTGTVGAGNVSSVVINCTTSTFTVGGTITGLNGSGLVLKDSVSGHTVTKGSPATSFTLPAVKSGSTYSVSVTTKPSSPAQLCLVTGGAGTVTTQNVTTIGVTCKNVGNVGQFVWVTNPFDAGGDGSIAAFNINSASGALTAATNSPYTSSFNNTTEYQPYAIVADPSGQYVYVANSGCQTYSPGPPGELPCLLSAGTVGIHGVNGDGSLAIDAQTAVAMTGTATPGPDMSAQPYALAVDPDVAGPYLYVGTFDSAAGSVNLIEGFSIATPGTLNALTGSPYADGFNPSSNLVVDHTNTYLYSSNPLDGSVNGFTLSAGVPAANSGSPYTSSLNSPYAQAVSPTSPYLYVADSNSNKLYAYSYDGSGNLTALANYSVGNTPEGIAIDSTGQLLYVTNAGDGTVSAFTINPDGTLAGVPGSPFTSISTVPSPLFTPTAIAVDPSSQFVYVANGDAGTLTVFTIGANGVLSPVGGTLGSATFTSTISGGGPSSIAIR